MSPESSRHSVLIVDDESFVRESLVDLVESEGFSVHAAASGAEALEIVAKNRIDVVATDLQMAGMSGVELLEEIRRRGLDLPVVLLTGVGTVRDAVAAMKAGAFDFIQKPIGPDQFILLLRRAIEHHGLVDKVRYLENTVRALRGPMTLVGSSEGIERVRELIETVAPSDTNVLVTGESGTGKELVAREIHARSQRATENLVRVNCAALSETLFESEFFGHRRGSFTGAIADRQGRFAEAERGTLVLDEIGTLRSEMQAKLLRVLESREYQVVGESRTRIADVRVVAVTNDDLDARVKEGAFRADLFYRLHVFPISLPPLRERKEDIPLLAEYFLGQFLSRRGSDAPMQPLDETSLAVLDAYDWPGNVRELRNVLERATLLARSGSPDAALFEQILGQPTLTTTLGSGVDDDLSIRRRTEVLERELIEKALALTDGRRREAAELLGIDPKNLGYYLRKHDLGPQRGGGT